MADITAQPQGETIKREMARKSQDRIKVNNPTEEDFTVYWDNFGWTVKAHTSMTMPRYVAINFMTHLIDKILTDEEDGAVKAENAKRVKRGGAPMNVWEEQPKFEMRFNIYNPDRRKPWAKQIWGGIVEKYGLTTPEQVVSKPRDRRPADEQLMDEFDNQETVEPILPTDDNPVSEVEEK